MKTIALSANTSWYLFNFRKSTINTLISRGYKVLILAPKDDYSQKLIKMGCDFKEIPFTRGLSPLSDLACLIKIFLLFRKKNIDCVCNFTPKSNIFCSMIAKILNVKYINNISGLGFVFTKNILLRYVVFALYKFSQSKASMVFFQNESDLNQFLRRKIVNKNNSKRIFGSGVDLDVFKYSQKKKNDAFIFLFAGRILKEKGIFEYVSAAENILNKTEVIIKFQIAGFVDGSPGSLTFEEFDQIIKKPFIEYLGKSDNVNKLMSEADCIVLPTYYKEGLPKTLLESSSIGRPMITTSLEGNDVVEDGINGFICEPKSISDLEIQMMKMIRLNYNERIIMGENARLKAERIYDERVNIENYLSQIENLKTK
tara:strand:+ start:72 stop:1181 length:1110 start_codon:yes stop_codon:yes gene_type:complete